MNSYPETSRPTLAPFVRQESGPETVIGLPDRDVFIALPNEAIEVLDWLEEGRTCGEARALYREHYGEELDLDSFLSDLEARGFVYPSDSAGPSEEGSPSAKRRHHFSSIPRGFAQSVFHPLTGLLAASLVIGAAWALLLEPNLLPHWQDLAFEDHLLGFALALLAIDLTATFLHEMGHLLAARARGIGARLGVGNRLWVLVAETDMTGVWAIPPRQRYLPFVAGPLVDLISASVLVLVLFAAERGALALPSGMALLLPAVLLSYGLRLLWQCYFFVRTDFYYVFANAFGCKNLMGDTETYLANLLRRTVRRGRVEDQSHIPRGEMRVVRVYAGFWILGRIAALWVLVTVAWPLMLHYLDLLTAGLRGGPALGAGDFTESLVITLISLSLLAAGLFLWLRQLLSSRGARS